MISARTSVLLCDEDRDHTALLLAQLVELGHSVTIARSCSEAFAVACSDDFDALVAAPSLRDGTALMLPRALGLRRPRLVVLVTRMSERLAQGIAQSGGFDAQLTKVVDPRRLDRLVRGSVAAALALRKAGKGDDPSPTSVPAPR